MSKKIYLDACFIVAEHIKGHTFYKQASSIAEKNAQNNFVISSLVLDEVIFSLTKYKIPKREIVVFIKDTIINASNIDMTDIPIGWRWVDEYLSVWERSVLSPRDAMHLYFMRINRVATIATFDNDFIDNQKKLGITVLH